jgi:para-nitrobenzyl esterase
MLSLLALRQWPLVLLLAGSSPETPSKASQPPTVKLEVGVLEGIHLGSSDGTSAFLGVPYAASPVGERRWKAPQDVTSWVGTRKATVFGASCPQLPQGWLPDLPWSEDCLYLNVWTPRLSPNAALPVIVWFHGGGNKAGRSEQTALGPAFSRLGVVVVSFNYRLGPFGFLAHPALTAESEHHTSGNYGLLDQLQALEWTRHNISQFGGDPNRLTVVGHSAGAFDICLLMASPLARGMFQQAILESGECQSALVRDIRAPLGYNALLESGEDEGQRLANDLNVPDGPDALEKLRRLPADEILRVWSRDPKVRLDAVVDGWIVPEQPARVFADGRQAHIPVLVGSAADEATVFGHQGPTTVKQYREYLTANSGKYSVQQFQAYPVTVDGAVAGQYLRLQNDFFAFGAYSLARAMTRAGQKAYVYLFSFVDTGNRVQLGAFHGEELMFLSDSFPNDWKRGLDETTLGELMRASWTQFAKTGDPNVPGLLHWPAYEATLEQVIELGRTVKVGPLAHAAQLRVLEQIMNQILAETAKRSALAAPTH